MMEKSSSSTSVSQQKRTRLPKGTTSFQCGGTTFVVDERYQFIKQIGYGAYGVVCSALDQKTGNKVAIKKVPKAFEDLIDAKRIVREIRLLKFFDHEDIISVIDVLKPEKRTGFEDIYFVTDLMETDLHRVIYSSQKLSNEHIQYFMYQLVRGIFHMHSANVMHRDLKPNNILLNKDCKLKVCDLGLARGFDDEDTEDKTTYVVTRWYRAPEVILKAAQYTKAIDIWSIGCIFAELLGRTPLFPGQDYLDQLQRIIAVTGTPRTAEMTFITNEKAHEYMKGLPRRSKLSLKSLYPEADEPALDLLEKMLVFNPDKRITAEEILAHPYFEEYHSADSEPLADEVFDWTWDNFKPTKEILQGMIYDEAIKFHPEK
jgi:mitogen-activated protein kinase 1/3